LPEKNIHLVKEKTNNNFGIAFVLSIFIALLTGIVILILGKEESFLLINGNHNSYFDLFFTYFTHAGDGWLWVPIGLYFIFYKRKYLVAILAGIIISTIISQFIKRIVYPDELRPVTYLSENFPVHIINGLELNRIYSFPSGHTSTAFTMALIMAYILNKKVWSIILPILALLVGYSRVYLAQHFLTDVLAGMCIGILSAFLALMIYRSFLRSLNKKIALGSKTVSS
jgi:membrane-associated phospholipid phosphatase